VIQGSRRNKFAFCCRPPGPLARRERRCVPGAVREERATKPAGLRAAARRGAIPACSANRNRFMIDHRLSRQNVKLFLREPLVLIRRFHCGCTRHSPIHIALIRRHRKTRQYPFLPTRWMIGNE
jgi:hypothetical protein